MPEQGMYGPDGPWGSALFTADKFIRPLPGDWAEGDDHKERFLRE